MIGVAKVLLIFSICLVFVNSVNATYVEMEKIHEPNLPYFTYGDIIQFNLTVSVSTENGGSDLSISDLTIKDTLPPGLIFLPGNVSSTPSAITFTDFLNGTLFWDFGPGPFTETPQAIVLFNVTVQQSALENLYLLDIAEAQYRETVSNIISTPQVSDTVRIISPILDIKKSGTKLIHEGDPIFYQITLNNTGHLNAINVTMEDFLPTGVNYISGSGSTTSGTFDESLLPSTLIWRGTIGNVTGTHTVNITIPVTDDPLIVSNLLKNNASYIQLASFVNVINYWDSCETNVIHPQITLIKDCTLSKIWQPADITYNYTVTNTGDTPLSDVYIYDETLMINILGPIDLDPSQSMNAQYVLLNQNAGLYNNTALATGIDILGLTVSDYDNAVCFILESQINPSDNVGGEIIPAISNLQRIIVLSLTTVLLLAIALFNRAGSFFPQNYN